MDHRKEYELLVETGTPETPEDASQTQAGQPGESSLGYLGDENVKVGENE